MDVDIQNLKTNLLTATLQHSAKKSCELWSTNNKVLHVYFDPPKSTFFGRPYNISTPKGSWPFKFLHVLEID